MAPRKAAATTASSKAGAKPTRPSTKNNKPTTTPKPAVSRPKRAGRPAKTAAPAAAAAAAKPKPNGTTATSKKRKAVKEEPDDDDDDDDQQTRAPAKAARVTKKPVAKKPAAAKASKPKVVINEVPTQKLNVYVCGEGSSGELGLGTAKNAVDVKRPRLNPLLPADSVGVVQVAVGGMHCVALTHDNKILTWGVNDQGALGRDTAWEGGLRDIDDADKDSDSGSESDEDADSGLNPRESTPTYIPSDAFPQGTVFVEVAAGDSSSFALTDDGLVYGWGTFRNNEGVLGFDAEHKVQTTPLLVPTLKKIKHISCGDNHVLALNDKGAVFAWGCGQQNQLGRRILERTKLNGLQPREFGLPKNITHIGSGAFHSFAVHKSGKVYGWGLNSFCETGVAEDSTGEVPDVVPVPTVIKSLTDKQVVQVTGGSHHSMARTANHECLVWGRLDGSLTGLKIDSLPAASVVHDERNRPRILVAPTPVPDIEAAHVAAGADHSIVVAQDGKLWSWGFSANYQTGQGTDDDIEVASIIDNTAVRGKKLTWAGAGGQFSVFTGPATATPETAVNGHA